MKNTTQAEPSAWSLEDVSQGADLGSLCVLVTKKAPPGAIKRAALGPGWYLLLSLAEESAGALGWYPHSQGLLTYSNFCLHPPPLLSQTI